MSSQGEPPESSSVPAQIDLLCDRFETAWKAGATPDLATYLVEIEETSRPLALRELLRVELEMRRARGDSPTLDEYQRRFPEQAAIVADAFQSLDRHESETIDTPQAFLTTGFHVRCPHCHNPIELVPDANLSDIECKSCGGSFSLTGNDQAVPQAGVATRIGHFELIERLGMGAFGTVWRALDTKLDRTVAVKIPRKGQLNPVEAEMFLREARSAAQLRHPNIVSVHEVGRDNDSVYLVSDLIQGMSLDKWLEEQPPTGREAAEICAKIADALQHAHEHGVIHRDLKPQNVLMDAAGEPHLTDFGLAKREAGEITMTMEGQLLGTPAYMSPEQARGESHNADQRSDVYSLGVVLFQLLTGELPFRGNVRMLLKQVLEDDAPPPRQLDNRIPRDLDTICQKCLAKEPGRRYQTARAFADDLKGFLRGEVIQARPVGRMERTWRWCKRNPIVTTSLVVGTIMLAALAWSFTGEAKQRKLAETRLERSRHNVYNLSLARAATHIKQAPKSARAILEDIEVCPWDLHDFTWRILYQASNGKSVVRIVQHVSPVTHVEYSADGKTLLTITPGKLVLWDVDTGKRLHDFDLISKELSAVACSPDGSSIFVTSPISDWGFKRLFDPYPTSLLYRSTTGGATFLNWYYPPDYSRVSHVSSVKQGFLVDVSSLRVVQRPTAGVEFEEERLFSGEHLDDQMLVSTDNAEPALSREEVTIHLQTVLSGCFSPKQALFVTTGKVGKVIIWERRRYAGKELLHARSALLAHHGDVLCARFSDDENTLITAGEDKSICVWDVPNGKLRAALVGHTGAITCISIAPDGNTLVSGSSDGTVRMWDILAKKEIATVSAHQSGVRSVAIEPNGKSIASCGDDGAFKQWLFVAGKLTPMPAPPEGLPKVLSVAYAPNGKTMALGATDGTARILNAQTLSEIGRNSLSSEIRKTAASADGKIVASASRDGTIKLWDSASARELRTLAPTKGETIDLAFSLDDSLLASLDDFGMVSLSDTRSGEVTAKRIVPGATSLVFSPDGKALVAGGGVHWTMWDLTTGKCISPPWQKVIKTLDEDTGGLCFSPRSSRFASFKHSFAEDPIIQNQVNETCELKTWDWMTGECVRKSELSAERSGQYPNPIYSSNLAISPTGDHVAWGRLVISNNAGKVGRLKLGAEATPDRRFNFSPDGRTLVSVEGNGELTLWDPDVFQQKPSLLGVNGCLSSSKEMLSKVTSCAFSWDGSLMAVGQENGRIAILDAGRCTATIDNFDFSKNNRVSFSPDCQIIWAGYDVKVCDVWTGQVLRELTRVQRRKNFLESTNWVSMGLPVISNNGKYVAEFLVASDTEPVRFEVKTWETSSMTCAARVPLQKQPESNPPELLAISDDGQIFAISGESQSPYFLNLAAAEVRDPPALFRFPRTSPDGLREIKDDGSLIDLTKPPNLRRRKPSDQDMAAMVSQPLQLVVDRRENITASFAHRELPRSRDYCHCSSNGRWLAVANIQVVLRSPSSGPDPFRKPSSLSGHEFKCNIYLWDMKSLATKVLTAHFYGLDLQSNQYLTLAVANDAKHIVLSDGKYVWFLDGRNGTVNHQAETEHLGYGSLLAIAPDGLRAFGFSNRGKNKVGWSLETGKELTTIDQSEFDRVLNSDRSIQAANYEMHKEDYPASPAYRDPSDRFVYCMDSDSNKRDGRIFVFDKKDKRTCCTIIVTHFGEWLVVTPDGRYESSNKGDITWAYWTGFENSSRINISAAKKKYFQPGLLQRILSGADQRAAVRITYGDIVKTIGSMAVYEEP